MDTVAVGSMFRISAATKMTNSKRCLPFRTTFPPSLDSFGVNGRILTPTRTWEVGVLLRSAIIVVAAAAMVHHTHILARGRMELGVGVGSGLQWLR